MVKASWLKKAFVVARLRFIGYVHCGNGKFYKKKAVITDSSGRQVIYRVYGDDSVIFHYYWDN